MSTPLPASRPEAAPPSANLTNLLELMEELVNEVAEESRAKTTRYQQGQQWKIFEEWCHARGVQSLPADPEILALFIYTLGIGGKRPNTLRGYASSIAAEHRSKEHDSPWKEKVRWSSRVSSTGPRKRASAKNAPNPLTAEDLWNRGRWANQFRINAVWWVA